MPSSTGEKSTRSRGRNGAANSACGSAKCMPAMSIAEAKKDKALSTKTASRPKKAATTPPTDAPINRLTDHVAEESVLATRTSSLAAMLGTTELRAGSKNAAIMVSASSNGYTSQTVERERTSNMASTTAKRTKSAAIITYLRRNRSFTTPAIGPTKVCGNTCSTSANATELARPVNCKSSV